MFAVITALGCSSHPVCLLYLAVWWECSRERERENETEREGEHEEGRGTGEGVWGGGVKVKAREELKSVSPSYV